MMTSFTGDVGTTGMVTVPIAWLVEVGSTVTIHVRQDGTFRAYGANNFQRELPTHNRFVDACPREVKRRGEILWRISRWISGESEGATRLHNIRTSLACLWWQSQALSLLAGFWTERQNTGFECRTETGLLPRCQRALPAGVQGYPRGPPYSRQEATNYAPGPEAYPTPAEILRNASNALLVGSRIGIIHYFPPAPPPELMCIAIIGVICGFNNKIRAYSVYEKIA